MLLSEGRLTYFSMEILATFLSYFKQDIIPERGRGIKDAVFFPGMLSELVILMNWLLHYFGKYCTFISPS